jgi:uncharacterized protein with HEPN domain
VDIPISLWDMLDAACAVQEFVTSRSFSDYVADRMLRSAVVRHLEIIGGAANGVAFELLQERQSRLQCRRCLFGSW